MYKKIAYPYILLLGIGFPFFAHSQGWDCSVFTSEKRSPPILLNLNGGIASHFGDISIFDINPGKKITNESGPGFGVIGTWYITHTFGISGQILAADIRADKSEISFQTRIFEYNLQGRINCMNIILPGRDPKFGFEVYAGIGQFFFTTIKYYESANQTDKTVYPARVPEFVYFFGGGFSYKVSKNIRLNTDLAIRQCQTDRLDEVVRNNDFDYYSYFSLGVSFDISRWIRPKVKTKYELK